MKSMVILFRNFSRARGAKVPLLIAALAAAIGLAFAACGKGGGSLPSPLPDNAGKKQVAAAIEQFKAYCEAKAEAEDDREYAAAYSGASSGAGLLSLVSVVSDSDWREKHGPNTVAKINRLIEAVKKMEERKKAGK